MSKVRTMLLPGHGGESYCICFETMMDGSLKVKLLAEFGEELQHLEYMPEEKVRKLIEHLRRAYSETSAL